MSPGGMATPRKRDKLAAQLTWLANRQILNLPEDRRTTVSPRATPWLVWSYQMAPMSPAV